jgi:hypothetical protein
MKCGILVPQPYGTFMGIALSILRYRKHIKCAKIARVWIIIIIIIIINSVASARKRIIPTERPPLVSEVSANFSRIPALNFRNHKMHNYNTRARLFQTVNGGGSGGRGGR